jgi:3D (Asp-Asp-Asp) domain-containing protein
MKKILILILIWLVFLLMIYSIFFVINSALEPKIQIMKEIEYIDRVEYKPLEYETYEVTAYTAGFESTGKKPSHPDYGITASGEMAIERITIACPPSMKFGTRVYLPAFETVFTCQDRGSAITEGKLDVYMEDIVHAQMFGRQHIEGVVLP